jgi:hypothetical protein
MGLLPNPASSRLVQ